MKEEYICMEKIAFDYLVDECQDELFKLLMDSFEKGVDVNFVAKLLETSIKEILDDSLRDEYKTCSFDYNFISQVLLMHALTHVKNHGFK